MTRSIRLGLLCSLSFLAGYSATSYIPLAAQGAATQTFPPVVEGKGMHWSSDDLAKRIRVRHCRCHGLRTNRMNVNRRLHHDKPQPSDQLKIMSLWDDAEWHANLTQAYVVIGGSGHDHSGRRG
jgi:hypothetical protein